MSNVKKNFVPLVEFLQANKGQKVSSILDQVIELCAAKSAGGVATASHKDDQGNLVAIRCSYYGKWMPVSHVEFGAKAGSTTGLNSMCKEGANNFSKAQRTFKAAKEALLNEVIAHTVQPDEVAGRLETLEAQRTTPLPFSVPGLMFDNLEDLLAHTSDDFDAIVNAQLASQPAPETTE